MLDKIPQLQEAASEQTAAAVEEWNALDKLNVSPREDDPEQVVFDKFVSAFVNNQHMLAPELAKKVESHSDQMEELKVAEAKLREAAARYWKMIGVLCTDTAIVGIRALLSGDSNENMSGHFNLISEIFFL